jgi:hypothetical protein
MTVNEVRELENLNPIGPEGDQHFVPLNMTQLDAAEDAAASDSVDDQEDGESDSQPTEPAGDVAPVADLQQQALNGAQVSSLLEILANLSAGLLTVDGAKALISGAFPTIPAETVNSIIAGVNEGVQPIESQPVGDSGNGP